jgi:hypothetical protein
MGLCSRYEREGKSEVRGYCDSIMRVTLDTMRSTGGYVFLLSGGAISWSKKRQPTVASVINEASTWQLPSASKEGLWLKRFVSELGWEQKKVEILCDNRVH